MSNPPTLCVQIARGISSEDPAVGGIVAKLLRRLSVTASTDLSTASQVVQRHPLGFLACRWPIGPGRTLRVHIWDRRFAWTQHPDWQIHDHVFSFKSIVLAGTVLNKSYSIDASASHAKKWQVYAVGYGENISTMTAVGELVGLRVDSSELHSEGDAYEVQAGVLHRSALKTQRAVTALVTQLQHTSANVPRVVGLPGERQISYDRSTATLGELARDLEAAAAVIEAHRS